MLIQRVGVRKFYTKLAKAASLRDAVRYLFEECGPFGSELIHTGVVSWLTES